NASDDLELADQIRPDEPETADEQDRVRVATPRNHKRENAFEFTRQLDATQMYLNEIGFSPLLTPEEEVYFSRLPLEGDEAGRKRMVESSRRGVVKIARRYIDRRLRPLGLGEGGNLALMRAGGKVDPERGRAVSTYATWWIRHALERAIMNQARCVRRPI